MLQNDLIRSLGGLTVLEAILDTTEAPVAITDTAGSIQFVNAALEQTTGFTSKEFIGRPIWAFRALDNVAEGRRFFFEKENTRERFQQTVRWRCKDGSNVLLTWTVKILYDDDGTEKCRIGTAVNRTSQALSTSRAIAAEHQRKMLIHVTDNLSEPLFFIEPDGTIAYANSAVKRVYGFDPDELIGQPSSVLRPMDKVHRMASYMKRLNASGEAEMIETEALHQDGHRVPVELRTAPVFEGGEYIGLASVVYDMRERKELEAELRRLAGTDALTGVANRLGFETAADHEVKRAARYKHPLAVFTADIDHFKRVNDTFGHAAGDEALRQFADALRQTLRGPIDLIARTGGEEFVVILPETGATGAIAAAERARKAAEEADIVYDGQTIDITASFGVSRWHPEEETLLAALKRSDEALYIAKENGRNRVVYQTAITETAKVLVG